jgi:hypothetical protein
VRLSSTLTWPIAAGSLVAGFAVAQATGVRPLGGVVLVAGCGWCALRWRERAGRTRTAALVGIYLLAFAGSHGLAHAIGSWPAVGVAAAVTGASAWALADAPRRAHPALT